MSSANFEIWLWSGSSARSGGDREQRSAAFERQGISQLAQDLVRAVDEEEAARSARLLSRRAEEWLGSFYETALRGLDAEGIEDAEFPRVDDVLAEWICCRFVLYRLGKQRICYVLLLAANDARREFFDSAAALRQDFWHSTSSVHLNARESSTLIAERTLTLTSDERSLTGRTLLKPVFGSLRIHRAYLRICGVRHAPLARAPPRPLPSAIDRAPPPVRRGSRFAVRVVSEAETGARSFRDSLAPPSLIDAPASSRIRFRPALARRRPLWTPWDGGRCASLSPSRERAHSRRPATSASFVGGASLRDAVGFFLTRSFNAGDDAPALSLSKST
ncbi:hypothetical protein BDR04DRAFT_1164622 [Suillus decipiens]|nr:hypothetical protein BDR04DRAFT_1164622 [Suillus decipiens]